mgnify:CR=1 FL=1
MLPVKRNITKYEISACVASVVLVIADVIALEKLFLHVAHSYYSFNVGVDYIFTMFYVATVTITPTVVMEGS